MLVIDNPFPVCVCVFDYYYELLVVVLICGVNYA